MLNIYKIKLGAKKARGSEQDREDSIRTEVEQAINSSLNHSQYKDALWALPDLFDIDLGDEFAGFKTFEEANELGKAERRKLYLQLFCNAMHDKLYRHNDSVACINQYVLEEE